MNALICLIILAMFSLEDLTYKKISAPICGFFILIGLLMAIDREGGLGLWIIYSMIPGALIIAVSIVSKGKIGIGDGLCLIISSLLLGTGTGIFSFFLSLVLASVIGEALILMHRIKKGGSLPFVLFLFVGTAVSLMI